VKEIKTYLYQIDDYSLLSPQLRLPPKEDSRVKSQFSFLKTAFEMRKMGIKNTYDAGVKESHF
jgi:hypothetical protein